ncbi:Putative cAMP-independent regulatory protein [Podospora comata]|uniref:cAMP-independent regulatory protein n=1 Tax=Podospora comata TaxID=48703 RepID=A0ABY6SEV9_PODCO|nr:Putative cAMP-independent regulatory protein [Podospora comata]
MTTMETYHGMVKTPADAIKLFEACRLGLLPRVQRRLSEKERQQIRSGSVYVWDEREAGMRRWTDGKSWSASRVSGSFLTYREMEGKRGNGFGNSRRGAGRTPDSGRGSDEDQDDGEPDSLAAGYRYKTDGLMKQSFSITTSNSQHLHLISYYTRNSQNLQTPSTDPQLRGIIPQKGMYPESSLNDQSALTRSPMQQPPYPPQVQQLHHLPPGYPGYAPHPAHHGHYQPWPPSPGTTPPYGHPYNGHHHPGHPVHPGAHPAPYSHHLPQLHYGPPPPPPPQQPYHSANHHQYERERAPTLPPLQLPQQRPPQPPPQLPLPAPTPSQPPHHAPYPQTGSVSTPILSPPRIAPLGSPRSRHLQAKAREAISDPRLALNGGIQLAPVQPPQQHQQPPPMRPIITTHTASPPNRALSVSPNSDGRNRDPTSASTKASLSALLSHPTPPLTNASSTVSSEPNSAGPSVGGGSNSANSSPRTAHGGVGRPPQLPAIHDFARVEAGSIGKLNSNFRG